MDVQNKYNCILGCVNSSYSFVRKYKSDQRINVYLYIPLLKVSKCTCTVKFYLCILFQNKYLLHCVLRLLFIISVRVFAEV